MRWPDCLMWENHFLGINTEDTKTWTTKSTLWKVRLLVPETVAGFSLAYLLILIATICHSVLSFSESSLCFHKVKWCSKSRCWRVSRYVSPGGDKQQRTIASVLTLTRSKGFFQQAAGSQPLFFKSQLQHSEKISTAKTALHSKSSFSLNWSSN